MRIRPILAAGVVLLATACSSDGGSNAAGLLQLTTPPAPSAKDDPAGSADGPATTKRQKPPQQKDSARSIPDIEIKEFKDAAQHVEAPQRVAYDQSPPFGGSHDASWAACNGVVYTKAVRNENMVHALEHGAVWIAYNPDKVSEADVQALAKKVKGEPYMLMSPYPGLDRPVSLQSWGHRLKLDEASDPRVDEFIDALKQNKYTYPEPGATCDTPSFDTENPPPFDPSPPPAGSIPVGS